MTSAFEEQLRDCVKEICETVRNNPTIKILISESNYWEQAHDGHYRPTVGRYPHILLGEIEKLPSFQRSIELANNDSVVGPHLNQLVGTQMSKRRFDFNQLINPLVSAMVPNDGPIDYTNSLFE